MSRITGFGVLLCTGMMVWTVPSFAGFEFSGPSAAPAPSQQQSAPAPEDAINAPMPIVPMAPVESEPLTGPSDQVLKLPAASVATPAASAEPVYVRRQRSTVAVKAPKNEPMDTDALLKATENGESIAMTQDRLDAMQAQEDGRLLINPYPLEQQAVHNGGMGKLPLEQAMMEETGALRPVATPGKNSAYGMRERARITSRYDSDAGYLQRDIAVHAQQPETSFAITSMTPIPGGEGEPLNAVERAPLAPLPAPAAAPVVQQRQAPVVAAKKSPMPRPAIPQDYPERADVTPPQQQPVQQASNDSAAPAPTAQGGYSEAVGFGRDLPLALALSQVVPPEYSYAFGQDINVGSTVSWQGGKPWNQVLDEMLAPQGLKAVIEENQVTIQNARSQS